MLLRPLVGVAAVAAVATAGDAIWFELGVRHRAPVGALHGAVLLGAVGMVLGWIAGRVWAGLVAGVAAGLGGAAAYYALAALGPRGMNFTAMTAAWAAVWIVLAVADGRVLRLPTPRAWSVILGRAIVAAVFGGLAFYLVLDIIWGVPPPEGRNYFRQFLAWIVAWGPGVLAIASDPKAESPRRSP